MASEEPDSVEAVDPQPRRRVPPPIIDLEASSSGPKPRSGRRWPLVAAGLLGAVIALGAAAGAWVLLVDQRVDRRADHRGDDNGETNARLTRIETQLAALAHPATAPATRKSSTT